MLFKVFGQREAENEDVIREQVDRPFVWISIRDCVTPGEDNSIPKVYEHPEFWEDTLYLGFADFTTQECVDGVNKNLEEAGFKQRWRLFNESDAKQIYDFVQMYKDRVGLICVHCAAGICRSPAVARVLSLWLNGHDSGIEYGKGYFPNIHVQTTLHRYILERLADEPRVQVQA